MRRNLRRAAGENVAELVEAITITLDKIVPSINGHSEQLAQLAREQSKLQGRMTELDLRLKGRLDTFTQRSFWARVRRIVSGN